MTRAEYYAVINDDRLNCGEEICDIDGNYIISAQSMRHDCYIEKLETAVNWIAIGWGQDDLIYNGQEFSLTVRIRVVGKDLIYADHTGYIYLSIIPEGVNDEEYNGLTLVRNGTRGILLQGRGQLYHIRHLAGGHSVQLHTFGQRQKQCHDFESGHRRLLPI